MLDKISISRLKLVHPDLADVIVKADSYIPANSNNRFRVTCGVRTAQEQMECYKRGASKLDGIARSKGGRGISEHQYGMAVDLVPMVGKDPVWSGEALRLLSLSIKKAAKELKVPIIWGGDWPKFVDMPHYQLDRAVYKQPYIEVK